MFFLRVHILVSFVLGLCLGDVFSPNRDDLDIYGPLIAINDVILVAVNNYWSTILIEFLSDMDHINSDSDHFCSKDFDDELWYVYAVALGKNQSASNIFIVGEVADLEMSANLTGRTFVGVLSYTGSLTTINCDNLSLQYQFVENAFVHQEHLIMTTDPFGLVAYGFSNLFSFSYTAATNELIVHENSALTSELFMPFAVDYDGNQGIIAGFLPVNRTGLVGTMFIPAVTLFRVNMSTNIPTPISQWLYPIENVPSQMRLKENDFDTYEPKLGMSVSINPRATHALVGIQWLNTVLLFNYTTVALTLVALKNDGQETIGFGKNVAWLDDVTNSFAILANKYSISYAWISSQIYIYDSLLTNNSKPVSIIPNVEQPLLLSYYSYILINIISTPTSLLLFHDDGGIFIIYSAPKGYYASTIISDFPLNIPISSHVPCAPGTYKNVTGIVRCSLCPAGTKSDGTNATLTGCADCSTDAFCPAGSVTDSISNDMLDNIIQVVAYPKSPDISGLDDILFFTLFSIGSTPRCIVLSPIFWTLIITAVLLLITAITIVIKYCVNDSKANKIRRTYTTVFKRVDLIREGDMWAGGLATFAALVLCIACCVFSAKYYASYPIETAEPSTYTCDTSIRNAQFSTSLQSSAIPVSEEIQEMIDILNNQVVNLDIDFINTASNCTSNAGQLVFLSNGNSMPIALNPSCNTSNYIISYSALLPFREITVQLTISNLNAIGGLRIGLSAPGEKKSSTITLQDLNFSYTYYQTGRVLGHDIYSTLTLTKVINNTSPLASGDKEIFSGIWAGSFKMNYNSSFTLQSDYLTTAVDSTETRLTLVINEAPYYVLNEQSPIARLPEIVYHDFLFITTIIGMFVLIFVIVEVMILPCCSLLIRKCKRKSSDKYEDDNISHQSTASHSDSEKSQRHKHTHAPVIKQQTYF